MLRVHSVQANSSEMILHSSEAGNGNCFSSGSDLAAFLAHSPISDFNPAPFHPILTHPGSDSYLRSNNNINNANRATQRRRKRMRDRRMGCCTPPVLRCKCTMARDNVRDYWEKPLLCTWFLAHQTLHIKENFPQTTSISGSAETITNFLKYENQNKQEHRGFRDLKHGFSGNANTKNDLPILARSPGDPAQLFQLDSKQFIFTIYMLATVGCHRYKTSTDNWSSLTCLELLQVNTTRWEYSRDQAAGSFDRSGRSWLEISVEPHLSLDPLFLRCSGPGSFQLSAVCHVCRAH